MGFNGSAIKEYAVKPCGMDMCRESNSTKYLMSCKLFSPQTISPPLTTKSDLTDCMTLFFLSFDFFEIKGKVCNKS